MLLLKAKYALYTTLVFFIVSSSETFKALQYTFGQYVPIATSGGCPTLAGHFIVTVLFYIVVLGLMSFPRDPNAAVAAT
jgi:hypothetical protein